MRLTPIGHDVGLISDERYAHFLEKKDEIQKEKERLEGTYVSPNVANPFLSSKGLDPVKSGVSFADLLRRPQILYAELAEIDKERPNLPLTVQKTVEIDIKYAGYIKKELASVERFEKLEHKKIPDDFDYTEVGGLRIEARQKLQQIKPLTLGQASRISGVSPADISVLLLYLGIK